MFKKINCITKALVAIFVLGLASAPINAQLTEVEAFLKSGRANANVLTQAYLQPLSTSLSTNLNSGWTTKAAPTKTLGFSLQLRISAAAVPSSGDTFNANNIGLSGVAVTGSSSNTITGPGGNGQTISSTDPNNTFSFALPGGADFGYVPMPMIQANLGLIKGTDVTVRFVPEISSDDLGDVSLIGAGIKHDINQWIPGGKLLPVDISVMAAFTQVTMNADLELNRGDVGQRLETTTNAFVMNALVGKTLPFISAYAGVGYQQGTFEVDMLGDYTIGTAPFTTVITDPVSYTQDSDVSVHALAGFQVKLGFIRIFAEATASEYVTYNAGFGIGLRN